MSLIRKEARYDSFCGNYQKSSMVALAKADARLAEKKHELDNAQYIYNLVERDTFNTYKDEVNYEYSFYALHFTEDAQKWLGCLNSGTYTDGEKIDGRRSYDEKTAHKYVCDCLNEFFGAEVELLKIYNYNFGEAWEYVFAYNGRRWQLTVPNIKSVSFKSFQTYGDYPFKIHLSIYKKDNDHVSSNCKSSFLEEDFKDCLDKILQEGK